MVGAAKKLWRTENQHEWRLPAVVIPTGKSSGSELETNPQQSVEAGHVCFGKLPAELAIVKVKP